ncbi:MAG: hypothetical protein AAFO76_14265 [Cyanobacteria bacterium J06607_15]
MLPHLFHFAFIKAEAKASPAATAASSCGNASSSSLFFSGTGATATAAACRCGNSPSYGTSLGFTTRCGNANALAARRLLAIAILTFADAGDSLLLLIFLGDLFGTYRFNGKNNLSFVIFFIGIKE